MTIDYDLTEDDFIARFKPVPNPFDPNAGFDGCLFETFGEELAYVKAQNRNLVWTLLDGDGQFSIASGFHVVNRLGYLITSVPVAPDHSYSVACEDMTEPDDELLQLAARDLLDALTDLVERDRAEAASCGFTDDEMSWLDDARRAIAKAKGGAP